MRFTLPLAVTLLRLWPVLCLALLGAANTENAQRLRLVAFTLDGFESAMNERSVSGDAEQAILQRFGGPDYTASTTQREGDGLFQTKSWYYQGLEIRISRPVGASDTWFRKIILTSPAYQLKFGLSIGAKKSQLLQELGRSGARVKPASHSLIYSVSDSRDTGGVALAGHAGVEIFFDPEDRAEKIAYTD